MSNHCDCKVCTAVKDFSLMGSDATTDDLFSLANLIITELGSARKSLILPSMEPKDDPEAEKAPLSNEDKEAIKHAVLSYVATNDWRQEPRYVAAMACEAVERINKWPDRPVAGGSIN